MTIKGTTSVDEKHGNNEPYYDIGNKPTWVVISVIVLAFLSLLYSAVSLDRGAFSFSDGPLTTADLSFEHRPALFFTKARDVGWSNVIYKTEEEKQQQLEREQTISPPSINWTLWKRGTGGLTDKDRFALERIYGKANSVFEYGLGESTFIANAVNVPRYAGIDSDPVWVQNAASQVASHFRFYLADIGPTGDWGVPLQPNLTKALYNYQLAPLVSEMEAFDVYMVDGRYRFPCMMASFLHASYHGKPNTTVLIHDCKFDYQKAIIYHQGKRKSYRAADHILDMVHHSGDNLCVYERKWNTTDQMLYNLWYHYRYEIN